MSSDAGYLQVLNVGAGDLKLRWNPDDTKDAERARALIKKMMRDGFAIVVELSDGSYQRVTDFDEANDGYVIVSDRAEGEQIDDEPEEKRGRRRAPAKATATKKKPATRRRLPRQGTRATAIGRTAGG